MRTAIVMRAARGGAFAAFRMVARLRLGGALAGGRQFVSWIHERDFVRAVLWLLARDDLDGPVNVAAPAPLPQREFARALRAACGVRVGLSGTASLLEIAAFLHRTETELLLKSRRVVPARLIASGFEFEFRAWPEAARDLVARFPSGSLAGQSDAP
jgi:NAD dependent epimerase/dehydratase family enzyme